MIEAQVCSQCGKPIIGRLDKRFCDAYCRNAFNNKVTRSDEQYIKLTNRSIRKNRRILKTLSPIGKSTVRKEVLDALGYDYNSFSSLYKSSKGAVYYLSYDYGFTAIVDARGIEKAVIITRQDYMSHWQPWGKPI